VTLRLIVSISTKRPGAKSVKDIKEQDVYMGDIPLMTMNGTSSSTAPSASSSRRCIVRPACSSTRQGQDPFVGQAVVCRARDPYRGSWLDIEFDPGHRVRAYRPRRKIPVTPLTVRARSARETT